MSHPRTWRWWGFITYTETQHTVLFTSYVSDFTDLITFRLPLSPHLLFTTSRLVFVTVSQRWQDRAEDIVMNHPSPWLGCHGKVSPPNFQCQTPSLWFYSGFILWQTVESTLDGDIQDLNFQTAPKWWRQIGFSVLLLLRGRDVFSSLPFTHQFSNLSVNCRHVMKSRREWNPLNEIILNLKQN